MGWLGVRTRRGVDEITKEITRVDPVRGEDTNEPAARRILVVEDSIDSAALRQILLAA